MESSNQISHNPKATSKDTGRPPSAHPSPQQANAALLSAKLLPRNINWKATLLLRSQGQGTTRRYQIRGRNAPTTCIRIKCRHEPEVDMSILQEHGTAHSNQIPTVPCDQPTWSAFTDIGKSFSWDGNGVSASTTILAWIAIAQFECRNWRRTLHVFVVSKWTLTAQENFRIRNASSSVKASSC